MHKRFPPLVDVCVLQRHSVFKVWFKDMHNVACCSGYQVRRGPEVLYGALPQTRRVSGVGLEMHACVPFANTMCKARTRCIFGFHCCTGYVVALHAQPWALAHHSPSDNNHSNLGHILASVVALGCRWVILGATNMSLIDNKQNRLLLVFSCFNCFGKMGVLGDALNHY